MKLTQIPLPGHSYGHRFKKTDGTFFEIPCTADEYFALGKTNPQNPTHSDGEWIASHEFYDIPLGCYVEEVAGRILFNADGRRASISKELFGDGTVTQEIIAKVDEQYSLVAPISILISPN